MNDRRWIISLALAFIACPVMAITYHVDGVSGDDSALGTGWGTALKTITNALTRANPNDDIWVAAGTYSPGNDVTDSFRLKSYVALYGGFTNGGNMVDRNWMNNATILDGSNVNYHVVKSVDATNSILDGFIVARGNAVYYIDGGREYEGAGMFINGGSPSVANCVFSNNYASAAGMGRGAGIATYGVTDPNSYVSNCIFVANQAEGLGGGAMVSSVYPAFKYCAFRDNRTTVYGYGGGIYIQAGTMYNCDFVANTNHTGGGDGGAACCGYSPVGFVNCTFRLNHSFGSGGGVYVYTGGKATMVNCSFSLNSAATSGGGVYVEAGAGNQGYVTNCILWGDTGSPSAEIDQGAGSILVVSYSDVQQGSPYAGTSNINANPLFANAANDLHEKSRGGRWTPAGWVSDNAQSPCIDAGDESPYANESQPNGGRINMGAYGNIPQASRSSRMTVSATDGTFGDRVRVTWSSVAGATGYQVWRSTNVLDAAVELRDTNALSYDDKGAVGGQLYYYWVLATNSTGIADAGSDTGYRSRVYYVRTDGDDAGDGLSWVNALRTITNALTRASQGQIWVAAGSYSPGDLVGNAFNLKSYVSLYGGFTNGGNTVDRDWRANETILDGSNINYHVIICSGTIDAVLDGFTIARGNASTTSGNGYDMYGGGMVIDGGLVAVNNCLFTNNAAVKATSPYGRGGGIYVSTTPGDANAAISNCIFVANTAREAGGGGFIYSQYPVFKHCVFRGNSTTTYPYGGGVFAPAGTFRNCDFISNWANGTGEGGAMCVGWGSGIEAVDCTFVTNVAAGGGSMGGACFFYHGGASKLVNCSFSGNRASSQGGAIMLYNDSSGLLPYVYLTNCTLWGDAALTSNEIYVAIGALTAAYSDIQGGYDGTSNLDVDPLFASATDLHEKSRGGRWAQDHWIVDDVTSPCIDAGDPAGDYSLEPEPNGHRVNMGAYGNSAEASATPFLAGAVLIIH